MEQASSTSGWMKSHLSCSQTEPFKFREHQKIEKNAVITVIYRTPFAKGEFPASCTSKVFSPHPCLEIKNERSSKEADLGI